MQVVRVISFCLALTAYIAIDTEAAAAMLEEEMRKKFCIQTEPSMLLTDIERPANINLDELHCGMVATTLTVQERDNLLVTICGDQLNAAQQDYQYFRLRNGDLEERGSYKTICDGTSNPLLAWVPFQLMQRLFAIELNPEEVRSERKRVNYIAKAKDVERQLTDLCAIKHVDMTINAVPEQFSCVSIAPDDNVYGLNVSIHMLIEILPIMYEVRNLSYLPWSNVTQSYKTLLGKSSLRNPHRVAKQIYGYIDYAYVEKVKLNTSAVLGDSPKKLPLLFEHKKALLELDENGIGGVTVKNKAFFGRTMDPKSSVKLDVIGQWSEHTQKYSADIYECFGFGIKRFKRELQEGTVVFVMIDSTEPVFESVESSIQSSSTLHVPAWKKVVPEDADNSYERLLKQEVALGGVGISGGDAVAVNSERVGSSAVNGEAEMSEWEVDRGGPPYPGFYPYFVASVLIVGLALLLAVGGMIRSCSKESKNKQKYGK